MYGNTAALALTTVTVSPPLRKAGWPVGGAFNLELITLISDGAARQLYCFPVVWVSRSFVERLPRNSSLCAVLLG